MKVLQDILYKVPILEVRGDLSVEVNDFDFDSRKVFPGSLFVALKGTVTDGHTYIQKAEESGAIAIVCEEMPQDLRQDIVYIKVKDSAVSLAHIASNFYENPANELKIIGVTGTNGKTTVATLLYSLMNELGFPSGLFSTVTVRVKGRAIPATHTTPDAKTLHKTFRTMVDEGCEYCFMEVSSHALHQKRTNGIPFTGAVFTNLTHDHLDYHNSFREYLEAKQILFNQLPPESFALTNLDDKNGEVMTQNSRARKHSYGMKGMADYKGRIIENTFEGIQMEIEGQEVWFRLIGGFNAYNLLAVYATALLLGHEEENVLLEMSRLENVNGRFQSMSPPDRSFTAIVDYAHTPDALKNVLATIRDIGGAEGKVITVVGCGGNRDKEKRPLMGKIAAQLSDQVIFTSDNPRNEDPATIIAEMVEGVSISQKRKILTVENRKEAIAVACRLAAKKDIVLVAGKGHESYQEINGVRYPFDDKEILLETFKDLSI